MEELCGSVVPDATQAPDDATQAPDDANQAPDDATQAPDDANQAPDDATRAPDDATQAPDDATQAPDATADMPAAYDPDDNPDQWEEHFLRALDRWQNYDPQMSPVQYRETSPGTLEGLRSRLSFFAEVPSLMTLSGRVVAEHELHRNEMLPETLLEFVNNL